jgi:hypothetical protein
MVMKINSSASWHFMAMPLTVFLRHTFSHGTPRKSIPRNPRGSCEPVTLEVEDLSSKRLDNFDG